MGDNDDRLLIAIENIAFSLVKQVKIAEKQLMVLDELLKIKQIPRISECGPGEHLSIQEDLKFLKGWAEAGQRERELKLMRERTDQNTSVEIKAQAKAQTKIAYQELQQIEDNE